MENYRLKEILELTKANLIKNKSDSQYGICKELRQVFFPIFYVFQSLCLDSAELDKPNLCAESRQIIFSTLFLGLYSF